ncbi:MAG: hypothetical protein IPH27_11685 [Actinomycetales bacterium]|nr:hypothetical protein [Candidatus Phosphoribacter baldrii]
MNRVSIEATSLVRSVQVDGCQSRASELGVGSTKAGSGCALAVEGAEDPAGAVEAADDAADVAEVADDAVEAAAGEGVGGIPDGVVAPPEGAVGAVISSPA